MLVMGSLYDNQINEIGRTDNLPIEQWIENFESDLDNYELPDQTISFMHAKRTNTTEQQTDKISIFWHNKPIVAYVGFLLYHDLFLPEEKQHLQKEKRCLRHELVSREPRLINMKKYAAFMKRWIGLNLNNHLRYIQERENQVRCYYSGFLKNFLIKDRQTFLETLTNVSCFLAFAIISFQNVISNGIKILRDSRDRESETQNERSTHFSILYQEIMQQQLEIKLDMLNLSNQIPWFAVQAVFSNSDLSKLLNDTGTDIHSLVFSCFDDLYPSVYKFKVHGGPSKYPKGGFKHLLHIFHWTRTPEEKYPHGFSSAQSPKTLDTFYIPSATDLLESATVFYKIDDSSNDVRYHDKIITAQMHLTPLILCEYSLELFGSLLDFEQWYLDCGFPVTKYIACMARLLQTEEDVKLLEQKGIVRTSTVTDRQNTLREIKKIGSVLPVMSYLPDEIDDMSKKVRKHHDSRASRLSADLKSQFCPNKWVFISVTAAICLFILSFIQTLYGTLGYYKPVHSN
ncbi:hypothetical protein LUZ63_014515 [Rhynchospora breviuscula]|uniref:Uncharacterized protein n=1 Tax=Rhynchospora breviuscula TaxID=2022672 RepID=A0A9Q0HLY1_9POAL|nr:hypothetical protein LUZ63_014515 [Rhynchospora breviuscula]